MTQLTAPYDLAAVLLIFNGSDGGATKALYDALEPIGPAGIVAVNIFRATKTSGRAKAYRGRQYRGAAYDRKNWSIGNLCQVLSDHAADLGIRWGWGYDKETIHFEHVLYVELPAIGQISFHCGSRGAGPEFIGAWDGARGTGPDRACRYVINVFAGAR